MGRQEQGGESALRLRARRPRSRSMFSRARIVLNMFAACACGAVLLGAMPASAHAVSISNLQVTPRDDGFVTVSWTTSSPATTQVYWDVVSRPSTTMYAKRSPLNKTLGRKHGFTIRDAHANTYYVRVSSETGSGTRVISGEEIIVVDRNQAGGPTNMEVGPYYVYGATEAVVASHDRVYVGGGWDVYGYRAGGFGVVNTGDGDVHTIRQIRFSSNGSPGFVFAVEPDGNGGYYVGGSFTHVDGMPASGLAHVLQDGGIDTGFAPPVGDINAMVRIGSTLYLGGGFGGMAIDVNTQMQLAWDPVGGGAIYDMEKYGNSMVVVGSFSFVDAWTANRNGAALVNLTDGASLPWAPTTDVAAGIYDVAIDGTTAYLAGDFTTVNGSARRGVAAVDLDTGALSPWDAGLNGAGRAVTRVGDTIVVAGSFTIANGTEARRYLAAFDRATATVTAWTPDPDEDVYSLLADDSQLYVAGSFDNIAGAKRIGAAAFKTSDFSITEWNPSTSPSDFTYDVFKVGNSVMLTGDFRVIGARTNANNWGAFSIDARTGRFTDWQPEFDSSVLDFEVDTQTRTVYVGGYFTQVNGVARNRLAALDDRTGALKAWDPDANNDVHSLARRGNTMYVGGRFTTVGGTGRRYAAAVSIANGSVQAWDPDPDNSVNDVEVAGSTVYLGGRFGTLNAGATPRLRLAAVDATTGVANGWAPNGGARVNDIEVDGDSVVLAGNFNMATTGLNGSSQHVARINRFNGDPTIFEPNPSWEAHAVAVGKKHVFIGGAFPALPVWSGLRSYGGSVNAVSGDVDEIDMALPETSFGVDIACTGTAYFVGQGNWQGRLGYLAPMDMLEKNTCETTAPKGPPLTQRSHAQGHWSKNRTIRVSLKGARDLESGIAGYSVAWTHRSDSVPDKVIDYSYSATNATKLAPGDGKPLWVHVRTVDAMGNWSSTVQTAGPFLIDSKPPLAPSIRRDEPLRVGVMTAEDSTFVPMRNGVDRESHIGGYSYVWTKWPRTIPNTTVDAKTISDIEGRYLANGTWYLHVRSRDAAGNWSPKTLHVGAITIARGTPRADNYAGTPRSDIISGRGMNDTIRGDDGNDTISGGEGNDVLAGEAGVDTMFGREDSDVMSGGRGADLLYGEEGIDLMYGGLANDGLSGGSGSDRLFGGSGRDRLEGDGGDDLIVDGEGEDVVEGGEGNDIIISTRSSGDDIDCGSGIDIVFVVSGDDVTGCEFVMRGTLSAANERCLDAPRDECIDRIRRS